MFGASMIIKSCSQEISTRFYKYTAKHFAFVIVLNMFVPPRLCNRDTEL